MYQWLNVPDRHAADDSCGQGLPRWPGSRVAGKGGVLSYVALAFSTALHVSCTVSAATDRPTLYPPQPAHAKASMTSYHPDFPTTASMDTDFGLYCNPDGKYINLGHPPIPKALLHPQPSLSTFS